MAVRCGSLFTMFRRNKPGIAMPVTSPNQSTA